MNIVSIKDKLVLTVGTCLVLSLGLIIAYSSFTIRQQAVKVAEKQALNLALNFSGQIQTDIRHFQDTAETLAGSFSGVNRWESKINLSRDTVINILHNFLLQHPGLSSIYTIWEPEAFDNLDLANKNLPGSDETGRFMPHWTRNEAGLLKLTTSTLHMTKDTSGMHTYYSPEGTLKSLSIPPGIEKDGLINKIFSISVPIIAQGKFVGIVGLDTRLDWLQRLTSNFDGFGKGANISTVSSRGTILSHSEQPQLIGQHIEVLGEDDLDSDLANFEAGNNVVVFDGDYLEIFQKIPIDYASHSLSVIIRVPLEVVTAEATKLLQEMLLLGGVLLLMALVVIVFIARRFVAPIRALSEATEKMSAGQLDKELMISSADEIGDLTKNFNTMYLTRRKAEEDILRHKNNLETILDSTPVGIVIFDDKYRVIQANSAAQTLFKKEFEALAGNLPGDAFGCVNALTAPGGCGSCHCTCQLMDALKYALLAGSSVRKMVIPLDLEPEAGHRSSPYLEINVEIVNLDGETRIILAVSDVSDRKEAEIKIEEYSQGLESKVKERTEELEIINDKLLEEIEVRSETENSLKEATELLTNEKTKLEKTNDEVRDLLKRSYTETHVRFENNQLLKCWEHKNCKKSDCPSYLAEDLRCWLQVGTFCEGQYQADVSNKIRNCEQCEVYKNATKDPLFSIGEYFNTMMSILDARAKDLDEARIVAQNSARAKSEFLANMSHEIRTPMNGLVGMVELLKYTILDKEQYDYLETIKNSSDALLAIINDVLDFSKIEAGKFELEKIDFNLCQVIDDISDSLFFRAQEKDLEFVCQINPEVPFKLMGDPSRLRQVIINLAGNAIKFTDSGEVVISVTVEEEKGDLVGLRFFVSDTGIGLKEDKIDELFKPFTQEDSTFTRKYGGTGLGLTICKNMIEMMSGEIGAKNREKGGAEFWFTADLKRQEVLEDEVVFSERVDPHQINILVVDNSTTNRLWVTSLLDYWQFPCGTARSTQEAVEKLIAAKDSALPFKIVITDLLLDKALERRNDRAFEGELLAQKVIDLGLTDLHLILMTTIGLRGDAARLERKGFSAVLTKPVKQSILFDCLMNVLDSEHVSRCEKKVPYTTDIDSVNAYSSNDAKILMAEDNDTNVKVARGLLGKIGLEATVVENGEDALQAIKNNDYDLVLMDCQMPLMDGFTATAEIRKLTGEKGIVPIIAMTANALVGDREKCLNAGMDDYMSKPLNLTTIKEVVHKWLARKGSGKKSDFIGDDLPEILLSKETKVITQLPVLDKDDLVQRLGGDEELAHEVLKSFLDEIPNKIGELDEVISAQDLKQIKELGHLVKGAGRNISAIAFQEVAYEIEKAGAENELVKAVELFPQLQSQYEKLEKTVKEYLGA